MLLDRQSFGGRVVVNISSSLSSLIKDGQRYVSRQMAQTVTSGHETTLSFQNPADDIDRAADWNLSAMSWAC
jgi:hypothetical protein